MKLLEAIYSILAGSSSRRGENRRGFTLIELLVVISIIAILVTLVVPTFVRAKWLARNAKVAARVSDLDQGCGLYRSDYNYYPGQSYMYDWLDTQDYTGSQVLAAALFKYTLCTTQTVSPESSGYANCNLGNASTDPDVVGTKTIYTAADQISSKPLGLMNYVWDRYDVDYLPVLYYPSRIGLTTMVTSGTDVANAEASPYSYYHNIMHTDAAPKTPISGVSAQPTHQSYFITQNSTPAEAGYKSFMTTIANLNVDSTGLTPQKVGDYILIAPGMDRMYGSADDLTNYMGR